VSLTVIRSAEEFRLHCRSLAERGPLGFVPTMGALHSGHVALMRYASQQTRSVAVSIFVNPTQFGPTEDLARYPRTLEADCAACEDAGVELVFAPDAAQMYPAGDQTRVRAGALATGLCGASRPHHFEGVCTVVAKLFALAGPCLAVFGRKDYQQWKVVQRLARDLFLPVQVHGHPIVREPDGLAMSSRNRYLSEEQRGQALGLIAGLRQANRRFQHGERQVEELVRACRERVEDHGLRIDYVELVDAEELQPLSQVTDSGGLLAVAAFAGSTRLIDNCVLGQEAP
jgi:pantoate--beta-alanine ligase